jgi:lysozyme
MTRTPAEARSWALDRVGDFGWDNLCLSFVRQAFEVDYTPASSWPTSERQAGRAWDRAQRKHRTSNPDAIPANVPVFWELNTEADHVAFSLGDGWCLSNDLVVDGRIDKVRIADVVRKWGGQLLGWTEDLVGNRVIPAAAPTPKVRRVDGVDISHHQSGAIDYAAAKRAGVRWLYHKATEGATFTDTNYAKRRAEAKAAGLPFGAYHFARASAGDAVLEARHFLKVAAPKPGDLRPALDLETTEGLSNAQLRTWAAQFSAEVKKQTGVLPVVYTPFDLGDAVEGCVIWRPRYNDANTPPELPWDIWQFSNGVLGRPDQVAGFGHVDLNTMRAGLELDDLLIPKKKRRRIRRWVGSLIQVWYNLGDGSDAAKAADLTKFAKGGAHLIFLSEAGDRVAMLKAWAKEHGFHYWPGDGSPGAASTPVLIRLDVLPCVALMRTTEAAPATHVGAAGAGPSTVKRKVINEVVVRRRWKIGVWRRPERYLPGHWAASVDREDEPNVKSRRTLWRLHTRKVIGLAGVGYRFARTWVFGDLNTEWESDLCDEFRRADFERLPTGPTHGQHRTIDLWLLRAGRRKPTRRQLKRWVRRAFTASGSSDHHAVVVETN